MPRAKARTAGQWQAYVESVPQCEPIRFAAGHRQAIAALVPADAVVWITQRLQEVAGIVRAGSSAPSIQPTTHAELEQVRRLREKAEAVERGLRDLAPAGPARRYAMAEAKRLFFGREPPAPPNINTHLGIVAHLTAQALRISERKLLAEARRGRPVQSVGRAAVNLAAVHVGRVSRDPAVLAALASIVLDAADVPKAGRSTAVLGRYATAALAPDEKGT